MMIIKGKLDEIDCKHKWIISNFFNHAVKDSFYESPSFRVFDLQWSIQIYPDGEPNNSTEYLSIYLQAESLYSTAYPLSIDLNIGIKSAKQIIMHERKITHTYKERSRFRLPNLIRKSELLNRKSELVPSDTLTIICCIARKDSAPVPHSSYAKLSTDFTNIYMSKEKSDVKLNVKNEVTENCRKRSKTEYETYPAHKVVLSARSPVFAAMFGHDTQENKTGIVNIPDCDPDAFNVFLIFLYSGTVDFQICNVHELYKISEKYNSSDLKLMCSDFLAQNISTKNFLESAVLSNQFNDTRLLTELQLFFNKNFKNIITSVNWEPFSAEYPSVANKLLKNKLLTTLTTQN